MESNTYNALREIFDDTMNRCKEDGCAYSDLQYSLSHQVVISGQNNLERVSPRFESLAEVKVTQHKTIEAALNYEGKHVAVLNFANGIEPCAGGPHGRTQEESLCRTTTLYPCICDDRVVNEFYRKHDGEYILRANDDVVYTPQVRILRDDNYNLLSSAQYVDVITAVAPCIGWFGELSDEELYNIHVKRARRILAIAASQHVDVLILGAFGCGAFANDPYIVAQAYADVLRDYRLYFQTIEFANYDPSEYGNNYRAFAATLDEYIEAGGKKNIVDATNIDFEFMQYKPSATELNDVFKKCVSYLGSIEEEFEGEELFHMIYKSDGKYLVLFYNGMPTFFEVNGDVVIEWTVSQTIEFLLKFHATHPEKQITSLDYHKFSNKKMSDWISGLWWHVSDYIDPTLLEDEKQLRYREHMQSLMRALFDYDFEANVSSECEYYSPHEYCNSTSCEDNTGKAHYDL